jgi:endonuclease IV
MSEDVMKPDKTSPLLGAHFSITKGLHHALYEAETYGCTALQIFTKNTSAWKERTLTQEEINRFDQAREQTGITSIASHTSYLINLNDSKKELGSRVDRHEHIGEGNIGIKAFELLMNDMRFWDVPKIIETPKQKDGPDTDKMNLSRLGSLLFIK